MQIAEDIVLDDLEIELRRELQNPEAGVRAHVGPGGILQGRLGKVEPGLMVGCQLLKHGQVRPIRSARHGKQLGAMQAKVAEQVVVSRIID